MIYISKIRGDIGVRLPGRIGPYNLSPSHEATLPLRIPLYSEPNSSFHDNWKTVTASPEYRADPQAVERLQEATIRSIILPKNGGGPGALLVHKEQLSKNVLETLRRIVAICGRNLDQAPDYLVLLPHLDKNGRTAACFVPMAEVDAQSLTDSGLTKMTPDGTPLERLLFINYSHDVSAQDAN